MSTVGRIGCSLALTNVLTRSRGTPAAAFARYCRRKVLVAIQVAPPVYRDRRLNSRIHNGNHENAQRTRVRAKREGRNGSQDLPFRPLSTGSARSVVRYPLRVVRCSFRKGYSPGNAGRGRDDAQTFLIVIPGSVASSAPARPIGAPRWMKCGSGRYGWLPVPMLEL